VLVESFDCRPSNQYILVWVILVVSVLRKCVSVSCTFFIFARVNNTVLKVAGSRPDEVNEFFQFT
jgi:hypothetical protein